MRSSEILISDRSIVLGERDPVDKACDSQEGILEALSVSN